MVDVDVREDRLLHEVIHGDRVEPLRLQALRVPPADGQPPLAIERLTAPDGPTRPPVLLVHGLAQNRYTWRTPVAGVDGSVASGRSLAGALAADGFDVLNLELRGHGTSRAYGAGNATCFEEYVADLRRVVDRCAEPPFLIGHSLGAAVCLGAVAEGAPARGLVHLAGVYSFASANRTLRALARLSLRVERGLMLAPVRLSTGWAGDLLARLYAVTDIAGYGAPIAGWVPDSMERPLLEARLRLGFDWTSVEVWLQMCRWATGEPFAWAERFCAIDVPLFVIVGDHDPLVRLADVRELYDRSCSRDRQLLVMEAFEHQVHWGHIDLILGRRAPEEVWPRLLAWLRDR